jgi:hypothetical protein
MQIVIGSLLEGAKNATGAFRAFQSAQMRYRSQTSFISLCLGAILEAGRYEARDLGWRMVRDGEN